MKSSLLIVLCGALVVGCGASSSQPAVSLSAPASSAVPSSVSTTAPAETTVPTTAGTTDCVAGPSRDIAYRTIEGVDPTLLSLDVYPVAGRCDAPVVVWVHGGGWRRGDKAERAARRAAFYNGQGWMVVSVNYRLTTPEADPPVLYPDHNEDVAAALAWVNDEIAMYGGDPERVMLVGHSAGAGIAAAVMSDPTYLGSHQLTPDWLDCVVLLDGAGYDVAKATQADSAAGLYLRAFGDDPAVWADASPANHVGEGPLPSRVLVVVQGGEGRVATVRSFADQLATAGADAELANVSPLTHLEVNEQIGVPESVMTSLVTAELSRCRQAST